jgi:hypothetical protein
MVPGLVLLMVALSVQQGRQQGQASSVGGRYGQRGLLDATKPDEFIATQHAYAELLGTGTTGQHGHPSSFL